MLSKLIVFLDGEKVVERVLDRERIRIGRSPKNDLVLPHSAVSGDHAIVITVRNDSFLEDLHSTNGTWVNGRVQNKHVLEDGDEIRIAPYELKYVRGDEEVLPQDEHSGENDEGYSPETCLDMGRRPESLPPKPEEGGKIRAVDDSFPLATLFMVSGPSAGMEIELRRALTTVGKPGIQMATVARQADGYSISHLDGDSQPMVNGEEISPGGHAPLKHLDDVEIAGIQMKFILQRVRR